MSCAKCNNSTCTCPPSMEVTYSGIAKTLKNYKLESPIPDEVKDITKLQNWFRKNAYIPFAGTTQDSNHTYLRYLQNLARFSPTLASCINGIKFYAFTGKPKIIKSVDSEFDFSDDLKTEDLTLEQKNSFVNKLSLIKKGNMTWSELAANLYNSYKGTGNAFLSVEIKTILGQKFVYIKYHEPETVLYKISTLFEEHKVDISASWDSAYLKKYPPKTMSVYPFYDEDKNKENFSTIIHLKNGTGFYGRPDWYAASHDAFLEVKNKEYLLKAVHSNFTGQLLLEFEGSEGNSGLDQEKAQESGYKNAIDQWQSNLTNSGGSRESAINQSVIILERPGGASPVFIKEFTINTNEKFYDKISDMVERNIIKVNMWSKNLSGVDAAGGFSTDSFISELKAKLPVIQFYQNLIDNQCINTALDFIGRILEDQEFIDFNIIHKNPIEVMQKDLIDHQNKMMENQKNQAPNVNNNAV